MIYYFLIIFIPIVLIGSYFFLDKNDYIDLSFDIPNEQSQESDSILDKQNKNSDIMTNSSWEVIWTWETEEDLIVKDNFVDTNKWTWPEILVEEEKNIPEFWWEITKDEIDKEENNVNIPSEINLKVPFFAQAPDWDWSLPWKEACEEASLALAFHFVNWDNLTKQEFKNDLTEMFDLQEEIFWKYIDTSIAETAELLESYYDYDNYEIIEEPTVDDLKRELTNWNPIIAPFAWKKLWNSYYTNGWPRYHMLVIVWYNDEQWVFITNDVWTSRWLNFPYEYDVIMNSLHDLIEVWEWDILDWEKRVLVIR